MFHLQKVAMTLVRERAREVGGGLVVFGCARNFSVFKLRGINFPDVKNTFGLLA